MWKKVLLGCGILAVLAIVGFGLLIYSFGRLVSSETKIPAALTKPGILTGSGLISKSVVAKPAAIGMITDLTYSKSGQLVAVGAEGTAGIDTASGTVTGQTTWATRQDNVVAVTTPGGQMQYLNRGSWSSKATLLDGRGKAIWTYGGTPGVDDTAAGDINGDGKLEFVVGFNGGGGVHLIDASGKKVWHESSGNVWHVEMVDTNGDGKLEIVHSDAGGMMTVRDAKGKILSQNQPANYFSDFSLCRWPGKTSSQYAIKADKNAIFIFGFDGRTVAKLDAPHCIQISTTRGVPVKLQNGKPEFFAALVSLKTKQSSVLYIYNSSHKLVYQEVLPEQYSSIIAAPGTGAQPESLLLGGNGSILRCFMTAASAGN